LRHTHRKKPEELPATDISIPKRGSTAMLGEILARLNRPWVRTRSYSVPGDAERSAEEFERQARELMELPHAHESESTGIFYREDLELATRLRAMRELYEREVAKRGSEFGQFVNAAPQDREVQFAADIQQQLMPARHHLSGRIEVATAMVPCQTIAADYQDVMDLPDGSIGLAQADVAGRGSAAALLAALFQGIFAAGLEQTSSPGETVRRINRTLVRRETRSRFITFFYGVLTNDGKLSYCNAGHNPPLLVRQNGTRVKLEEGGIPLGIFEDTEYTEARAELNAGDMILAFSDGVADIVGPAGDVSMEDLLRTHFLGLQSLDASAVLEKLLLILTEHFADEGPLADDLSVLVAKYHGSAVPEA
jgi:serine phosphatase RsbU (regulator of sigma subunit)